MLRWSAETTLQHLERLIDRWSAKVGSEDRAPTGRLRCLVAVLMLAAMADRLEVDTAPPLALTGGAALEVRIRTHHSHTVCVN